MVFKCFKKTKLKGKIKDKVFFFSQLQAGGRLEWVIHPSTVGGVPPPPDRAEKGRLAICVEGHPLGSDVSFTPERIRGSGSSKGTTGSDSDQKERIH
ncbi:hypothetical protein AVEN_120846-1 [Araneus ventricosus]|uniref:Uncharacterized protein n=1 Tax=Araneus ventricosus TaxID=182803 RepID=A0A4Y2U1A6_ARAVE|nr:hypothetical protein AVEN_96955-1 [Araneus ventricosus]GBO05833.1 hypothetical protein AVEN_91732-1 [Araneus ventricosus]GBO05841.1 hypothetical protein AVEN_104701-1 [Araneus ventricosus]GBO05845.1 hypothetical protein AVEN_120846-1 [Araneus ventricosus]